MDNSALRARDKWQNEATGQIQSGGMMNLQACLIIAAGVIAAPINSATAQPPEALLEALQSLESRVANAPEEKVHFSPSGTVVEFYNQNLRHYFRTAEPAEVMAILNGAAGPGWVRTFDDFPTWSTNGLLPSSALPVCRFYAAGPNSHFFTSSAAECAQVKLDPGWHYEGTAYYVAAMIGGVCGSEYVPIYRAYNNRFAFNDSNHRFTSNATIYQQMIAQGWIGEGIVMCAPSPTTLAQQYTEQLIGGTWRIPYYYGSYFYNDQLTYDGLYQASSGDIYASGMSGHRVSTLGQYSSSLGKWAMLAPYYSSSSYPADFYVVTLIGNSMSGCYYFLYSSSSSLGSCTAITGSR